MIALFICNYVCASCFQKKKKALQTASYGTVLLFIQLELLNHSNRANCCLVVEKRKAVLYSMLVRHVCGFSLAMLKWQIKHALPFMRTSNLAALPHPNEWQIDHCMNTNGWVATARLITLIWSAIHKQSYHMLLTNCLIEDKEKKIYAIKKQATYTIELECITKAYATKNSWVIQKNTVCMCVWVILHCHDSSFSAGGHDWVRTQMGGELLEKYLTQSWRSAADWP